MDQKGIYFEFMAQFAHQAYPKYQEFWLQASQHSQQKLVENLQALTWKAKELGQANKRKGQELNQGKKQARPKRIMCQKCRKIFNHSSSLSRHEKKSKGQSRTCIRALPSNIRSNANRAR